MIPERKNHPVRVKQHYQVFYRVYLFSLSFICSALKSFIARSGPPSVIKSTTHTRQKTTAVRRLVKLERIHPHNIRSFVLYVSTYTPTTSLLSCRQSV